MNKFNLTFWGEILEGRDPRKVKARFAKMFSIDDPQRLEHFFSGDTIILRRNLERKVAAEYYSKLRKLGVEVRLDKVETTANGEIAPADQAAAAAKTAEQKETDWETARREAEVEAQQRKTQRAAEREAARQRAEAAAARRRAEQETLKRQQAEAETRRREQEEARRREQAEAEARHQAELQARQEQLAREAAERKAARDEAKRRAAEEAARRKAEEEEKKRLAREKAEAEKARKAQEKRRAAEALAAKRAEEAERKRRAEEQRREKAAKEKARRAEEKRKAAAEAARQRELEAEQKRRGEEERREQAVREKAARDEEAARIREERESARREEKTRREAERARVAEERTRQLAERERRQAEEKSRLEAERRAEEAREREQAAQRKLMEEQAIARAAEKLSDMRALKPARGKVTSSLDLPRRGALPPKVQRQAGAPNFYNMKPFRNTAEVRERSALAAKKKFTGLVAAAIALALLMILTGRYLERESLPPVTGPSAIATAPGGSLTMLAGDRLLLHDRAGVGTASVALADQGMPGAVGPITHDANGDLLLYASPGEVVDSLTQLYRCSDKLAQCEAVPVEGHAEALLAHPLSGELFLARQGRLSRLSSTGELLASAELPLPDKPVMQLDSGLLLVNSSEGPAISVYRYDDRAFGQQLDEILLLPPPALEREQTRVRDFTRAGDSWWVSLENPATGAAGLYLFDSDWNYRGEAETGDTWSRGRLTAWGRKVLLWREDSAIIRRFAAGGQAEADLHSELLDTLIAQQQRRASLLDLAWAAGFALLAAAAVVATALACHQYLRSLVYHSRPARGAEPIDEHTENIRWIDPAENRPDSIRRLWLSWGALALASVLLCIGLGASLAQLTAVLIALCGLAVALLLVQRSPPVHVGALDDKLILVDHRQVYHVASGSRIQYRGHFLVIDDVVVHTGSRILPEIAPEQFDGVVVPLLGAGARVDRKTIGVKLVEAHHPVARAAIALSVALLASLLTLAAGQFL